MDWICLLANLVKKIEHVICRFIKVKLLMRLNLNAPAFKFEPCTSKRILSCVWRYCKAFEKIGVKACKHSERAIWLLFLFFKLLPHSYLYPGRALTQSGCSKQGFSANASELTLNSFSEVKCEAVL